MIPQEQALRLRRASERDLFRKALKLKVSREIHGGHTIF